MIVFAMDLPKHRSETQGLRELLDWFLWMILSEIDPKSIFYKIINGKVIADNNTFKEKLLNTVWTGYDATATKI